MQARVAATSMNTQTQAGESNADGGYVYFVETEGEEFMRGSEFSSAQNFVFRDEPSPNNAGDGAAKSANSAINGNAQKQVSGGQFMNNLGSSGSLMQSNYSANLDSSSRSKQTARSGITQKTMLVGGTSANGGIRYDPIIEEEDEVDAKDRSDRSAVINDSVKSSVLQEELPATMTFNQDQRESANSQPRRVSSHSELSNGLHENRSVSEVGDSESRLTKLSQSNDQPHL